ncbi:unnamed protein product, partial [marine sediment metagenome]
TAKDNRGQETTAQGKLKAVTMGDGDGAPPPTPPEEEEEPPPTPPFPKP